MIAGTTVVKLISLQTDAGVAQSYADKAAFQGAGWDLSWRDSAGTALATQPTWTIAHDASGIHRLAYALPGGIAYARLTIPIGFRPDPAGWTSDGDSYDVDALAGLLLTSTAVPASQSAADADLGDVVDGDAFSSGSLTLTLGKLTPFGVAFADLASGWTITAAAKSEPADTPVALTCAFVVAAGGTFKVSWPTFPAGMALGTTERSKTWYIDVQLKRTSDSLIVTPNRYQVNVVWERNEST
ncbi:MAG: hypothetical protein H0W48_00460 [Methylibium sp.]|nr:hypothetical protein [Methylibium sp.]